MTARQIFSSSEFWIIAVATGLVISVLGNLATRSIDRRIATFSDRRRQKLEQRLREDEEYELRWVRIFSESELDQIAAVVEFHVRYAVAVIVAAVALVTVVIVTTLFLLRDSRPTYSGVAAYFIALTAVALLYVVARRQRARVERIDRMRNRAHAIAPTNRDAASS